MQKIQCHISKMSSVSGRFGPGPPTRDSAPGLRWVQTPIVAHHIGATFAPDMRRKLSHYSINIFSFELSVSRN